jgi:hypothetical protein
MRPLDAPKVYRNESAEGYGPVVAVLNGKWRVIECRDRVQWIVQSRDGTDGLWRGQSYCRSKIALLRICGGIEGEARATLEALPDWLDPLPIFKNGRRVKSAETLQRMGLASGTSETTSGLHGDHRLIAGPESDWRTCLPLDVETAARVDSINRGYWRDAEAAMARRQQPAHASALQTPVAASAAPPVVIDGDTLDIPDFLARPQPEVSA